MEISESIHVFLNKIVIKITNNHQQQKKIARKHGHGFDLYRKTRTRHFQVETIKIINTVINQFYFSNL